MMRLDYAKFIFFNVACFIGVINTLAMDDLQPSVAEDSFADESCLSSGQAIPEDVMGFLYSDLHPETFNAEGAQVLKYQEQSVAPGLMLNPTYSVTDSEHMRAAAVEQPLVEAFNMPKLPEWVLKSMPVVKTPWHQLLCRENQAELCPQSLVLLRDKQPHEILEAFDSEITELKKEVPEQVYRIEKLQYIMHVFFKEAIQRGLPIFWQHQREEQVSAKRDYSVAAPDRQFFPGRAEGKADDSERSKDAKRFKVAISQSQHPELKKK